MVINSVEIHYKDFSLIGKTYDLLLLVYKYTIRYLFRCNHGSKHAIDRVMCLFRPTNFVGLWQRIILIIILYLYKYKREIWHR